MRAAKPTLTLTGRLILRWMKSHEVHACAIIAAFEDWQQREAVRGDSYPFVTELRRYKERPDVVAKWKNDRGIVRRQEY